MKVPEFVEWCPKLAEEFAALLDDAISELSILEIDYYTEASEDIESEDIESRERQSFALPHCFIRVWRSGAKPWRVNRAVYRPYALHIRFALE